MLLLSFFALCSPQLSLACAGPGPVTGLPSGCGAMAQGDLASGNPGPTEHAALLLYSAIGPFQNNNENNW